MICADCPATLGPRNRSGRCRACFNRRMNADPGAQQRRREGIARHYADPANVDAARQRLRHAQDTLPEHERERRRERGKTLGRAALAAANAAMSDETRAENGRKRSATVLAWCPPEWRARYLDLTKRGRRAPVARQMVLAEIAAARLRVLDADTAATFLARLAPTYRCDACGRPCRTSGYWRYGSTVLTRDALILRAGRMGWPPAVRVLA